MSYSGGASWTPSGPTAAQRIQRLQDQAAVCGGQCTVRFSQSLEPVRSWIGLDERTKDGVCRRLVLRWFVEVVKEEPKFWSGLFDRTGGVNAAFIGTIMVQMLLPGRVNVAPQGKARDAGEGDAGDLQPLLADGFSLTMNNHNNPTTGENAAGAAAEVMTTITPAVAKHPHFKFCVLLMLHRTNGTGGHAIGAVPKANGSILLMDPNLGEFRFPSAQTLAEWMTKDLAPFYSHYEKMVFGVFKK
jgi:hypothetical protein